MSDKGLIHRFDFDVANLDEHHYVQGSVTTALHPSESIEHLLLRILGFIVWYSPDMTFSGGICLGQQPDICSQTSADTAIHANIPTRSQYKRFRSQFSQIIYVLTDKMINSQAFQQSELRRGDSLVAVVEHELICELEIHLTRHDRWSVVVEEGLMTISDGQFSASCKVILPRLELPCI